MRDNLLMYKKNLKKPQTRQPKLTTNKKPQKHNKKPQNQTTTKQNQNKQKAQTKQKPNPPEQRLCEKYRYWQRLLSGCVRCSVSN